MSVNNWLLGHSSNRSIVDHSLGPPSFPCGPQKPSAGLSRGSQENSEILRDHTGIEENNYFFLERKRDACGNNIKENILLGRSGFWH